MDQNTVQLYSDLVKIGIPVAGTILAAIIGGVSIFFATKLTHKNEFAKENRKIRNDLITKIARDISEYENLAGIYATALSNKVRGAPCHLNLEECRAELEKQSIGIRHARVNLKLLGLSEAETFLEEYLDIIRNFYAQGEKIDPDIARDISKIIRDGPNKVYDLLSKEFISNK